MGRYACVGIAGGSGGQCGWSEFQWPPSWGRMRVGGGGRGGERELVRRKPRALHWR